MNLFEKIYSNLYMIKVPIPKNPLKATNSYIIKDKNRNLVIDTGIHQNETIDIMRMGLKELDVELKETDFFITHIHSDHLDLALNLAPNSSKIFFNKPDANDIARCKTWNDELHNIATICGFPENRLQKVIERYAWHRYLGLDPNRFTILKEGDKLDVGGFNFKCIETPGHSRGHMCLYESDKKILMAGDHILDDITPNISLFSYEENPLRDYLQSLDKVFNLDIELALPGHRGFIKDCKKKVQELKNHHQMRVNEVLSELKNNREDAFHIASKITWDMKCDSWELSPMHQKLFASLETIAHLKYLEEEGLIQKEIEEKKLLFSLKE